MEESRFEPRPLLGFLLVEETAGKDGFTGALMVTDHRGYPMEFRATTPVRPSAIQRTLYGKQLDHFVGVELCGKTLLMEATRKPGIVLVADRRFLSLAEESGLDVVAVESGGGDAPPAYAGRFSSPGREQEVMEYLQQCAARFDLNEVFERAREALRLLAKEEVRQA
jgi:hypothetical protein